MKIIAIRTLTGEEILKELTALYRKEAVSNLLKTAVRDQKMNTAAQKSLKKTIARLLTEKRARELKGEWTL